MALPKKTPNFGAAKVTPNRRYPAPLRNAPAYESHWLHKTRCTRPNSARSPRYLSEMAKPRVHLHRGFQMGGSKLNLYLGKFWANSGQITIIHLVNQVCINLGWGIYQQSKAPFLSGIPLLNPPFGVTNWRFDRYIPSGKPTYISPSESAGKSCTGIW